MHMVFGPKVLALFGIIDANLRSFGTSQVTSEGLDRPVIC